MIVHKISLFLVIFILRRKQWCSFALIVQRSFFFLSNGRIFEIQTKSIVFLLSGHGLYCWLLFTRNIYFENLARQKKKNYGGDSHPSISYIKKSDINHGRYAIQSKLNVSHIISRGEPWYIVDEFNPVNTIRLIIRKFSIVLTTPIFLRVMLLLLLLPTLYF